MPHPLRQPLALTAALLALCAALDGARAGEQVIERGRAQQAMLLHDRHHSGFSRFEAPRHGDALWTTLLPGGLVAAPAVDALGQSYWSTQSGNLYVLSPEGQARWSVDIGGGSHSSPALDRRGNIYLATREGRVAAMTPDGDLKWAFESGGEILASPLLDEIGEQLVISVEDVTIALELNSGRLIYAFRAANGQKNSSPVMGPDGLVRVVNWEGWVAALSGQGRVAWRSTVGPPGFWSTPTLDSFGALYTAGSSGALVALSPGGRVLWSQDLHTSVSGFLALLPEGHILVPTDHALLAFTPSGALLWSHELEGDRLQASLAVSRSGDVLFGTESGHVRSVNRHGALNWDLEAGQTSFRSAAVIAAPVLGSPRAYIGSLDGWVFCLN